MINLPCSVVISNDLLTTPILLSCAATDKLKSQCLITPQDYSDMMKTTGVERYTVQTSVVNGNKLLASEDVIKLNCKGENNMSDVSSAIELQILNVAASNTKADIKQAVINQADLKNKNVEDFPLGSAERAMRAHDEMVELQNSDKTIESCFDMAKTGKSEFYIRPLDKLLYRKTQQYGFQVHQLVLPEAKRLEVLVTAHDSVWGGHFAFKKTFQRIQTSFFWPTMRKDIERYTKSCKICQLKKRVTVNDRVPITAIIRPPNFWDTINVDMIGPLDPPS